MSSYIGAGFAVSLFTLMPSTTVAWWRITIGAVFLLAWRRPWRRVWTRRQLTASAAFGVATALMNAIFYASLDHLPMGTAVSLEFLGPVGVAMTTGRGWRPRLAAIIALTGVASISGLGVDLADPSQRVGVVLALAAGGAWAGYIVLGRMVAATGAGVDGLALASATGGLVIAPIAVSTAAPAWGSPGTAAKVVGVALLSTVVPFILDQVNMGRLSSATFALLEALMPATSLAVGVVMLRQLPNVWELIGLVLVSVAVALAGSSASAGSARGPRRRRLHRFGRGWGRTTPSGQSAPGQPVAGGESAPGQPVAGGMSARHVVVMGPSGCGKSTLAAALAERLGRPFLEGDDVHPPANVAKMAAGTPLTDADRLPWLATIRAWMVEQEAGGCYGVVSCSALRRSYRRVLAGEDGDDGAAGLASNVTFVELEVDPGELARRMRSRPGHFMPASLLASQLATLEPLADDEPGVRVPCEPDPADTLNAALAALRALREERA